MERHYEKERPENEVFDEGAGPLDLEVKPLRDFELGDLDGSPIPNNVHYLDNPPGPEVQPLSNETAKAIASLQKERDQLAAQIHERLNQHKERFETCRAKLEAARQSDDYQAESQLAKRTGELRFRLDMAQKVFDRNHEDVSRIEAAIATLQQNQTPPEQFELAA